MFRPTPAQPQTGSRHCAREAVPAGKRIHRSEHICQQLRQKCLVSPTRYRCKPAQRSNQACRATAGTGDSDASGTDRPSQLGSTAKIDQSSHQALPAVPWEWGTILKVMFLWILAYYSVGAIGVPAALMMFGLDKEELGMRGLALLNLGVDVAQLSTTLLILSTSLKQFRPRAMGHFPLRFQGWWFLAVIAGWITFPVVHWTSQQSLVWFPLETDGCVTHLESSIFLGDWITNVAYSAVVVVLAPLWEELIFRGFLLASLTRYFPQWGAVGLSSLVFAMCHLRIHTFFPLLLLGVVFGLVFLKCRNLLPVIVLHGTWNMYVLSTLFSTPV